MIEHLLKDVDFMDPHQRDRAMHSVLVAIGNAMEGLRKPGALKAPKAILVIDRCAAACKDVLTHCTQADDLLRIDAALETIRATLVREDNVHYLPRREPPTGPEAA